MCTITGGGTPESDIGKVNAQLQYTPKAYTKYVYTFEAWTQSGARDLLVCYYYDNDENVSLNRRINIKGTRTTYTIYGGEIPKGGLQRVEFLCADQTGTFYVKMLEIKETNIIGNWDKGEAPGTTATLDYSVAADGVCTITVGGTPEPQNETDGWNIWKVSAQLEYIAKANTRYAYTFEAWTQSGVRDLVVNYYNDNDENVNLYENINITGTRKTYTINGEKIPKGGIRQVVFNCANQTGTFYVKMLEIKEY
jgi:hypothetical protein